MLELINMLPSRDFFLNVAMFTAIFVMVALIVWEYRFTRRMLVIGAMSALATATSGIGGELIRKLSYGGWRNPVEFITRLSEYEGTHYIGNALYIVFVSMILWRVVMRNDSGTFDRRSRGKYFNILALYFVIQGFIGRIGCLPAGCCYGKAYYGFLSVPVVGLDYPVYPAVQTELVLLLITLIIVTAAYIKRKNAMTAACVGYGAAIFIAEFMYEHTGELMICGLSVMQLSAIVLILLGIGIGRSKKYD